MTSDLKHSPLKAGKERKKKNDGKEPKIVCQHVMPRLEACSAGHMRQSESFSIESKYHQLYECKC